MATLVATRGKGGENLGSIVEKFAKLLPRG
jgi:hypothetical protein